MSRERRPHSKRADASAAAAESVAAVPIDGAAAAAAGGVSAALSSPAAAALERSRVAAAQRASATHNRNNTDAHSGDEEDEEGTRTAVNSATPAAASSRGRKSTGSGRKSAPCAFCEKSVNLNGEQDVTWMGPFNYDGQQRFVHGSCAKVGTRTHTHHRRAFKAEGGGRRRQSSTANSRRWTTCALVHFVCCVRVLCMCACVSVYSFQWSPEVRVSQHSFTHLRVPDAIARIAKTKCTKCGKKGGETKGRQRTEQEAAEGTDGSLMAWHFCFGLPVLSCSGTVSCRAGSCSRTYHLHCARAADCAFVGHFCAMYCPTHRALVKQHKDSDLVFQSVHNTTAQQNTPTTRKGRVGRGGHKRKESGIPVLLLCFSRH